MRPEAKEAHIAEDVLQAYLDGELGYDKIESLNQHLQACSSCNEQLHEMRQFFLTLEAAPYEHLRTDLTLSVMAAIKQRSVERVSLLPVLFGEGVVAVLLLAGVIVFASTGIFQSLPGQIVALWSGLANVDIVPFDASLSLWLVQGQSYFLERTREVASIQLPSLTMIGLLLIVFAAALFGFLTNGVLLWMWGGRSGQVGVRKRYG